MDPLVTSSLLSAGSSLLGGMFGGKTSSAQKEINYLNAEAMKQNMYLQEQSFYNPVHWRVQDAKRTGINPLVALGMNPYMGATSMMGDSVGGTRNSAIDGLAAAGQDVSRAIAGIQTKEQRDQSRALAALGLERAGLENELLRSQIAGQRAQLAPAISSSGGADPRYPAQQDMPLGYGDTAPFLRIARDRKGNPIRVYNDDVGDNEMLQAITALGMSVPDYIHGNFTKPAARMMRRGYSLIRGKGGK